MRTVSEGERSSVVKVVRETSAEGRVAGPLASRRNRSRRVERGRPPTAGPSTGRIAVGRTGATRTVPGRARPRRADASGGPGAAPRYLLGASLALGLVADVAAQERPTLETLDGRLQRVERVLDQSLLDQLQRIDSLQQELRELRGEIERLTYELERQGRRGNDLYSDTDQRLTELEEARDAGSLFGGETGGFGDDLALDGAGDAGEGGGEAADGEGRRAVVVPEGGGRGDASIPAAAGFEGGPQPPTGALRDTATQAEKTSYTRAYDLLARGENESAVDAFDAFLRSFPDGPYSDNAWYWQGEAMYVQRRFDEARRNFGVVLNSFPNSTKVPDARLKIGFALYEQGAFDEARRILTAVQDDYPGRSAAVLARKRLQQMDREGR